jgi:hypothetical protein
MRSCCIVCHVRCLQTEASPKKNQIFEKVSVRFGVKVMVILGFYNKIISIDNKQNTLLHVQFW